MSGLPPGSREHTFSLSMLRTTFLLLSIKSVLQEVFPSSELAWLTLRYKTCSMERGEKCSQAEARELLSGILATPTTYLLPSVGSIL